MTSHDTPRASDAHGDTGRERGRPRLARGWLIRHPWPLALGLIALALVPMVLLWDWNWFKGPVERQVEARTGRELRIAGDLDVDLGWTPTISAEGVRFGNAPWSENPTMAASERVEFSIALRPLLRGQTLIPQLRLSAPRLELERRPGGVGNLELRERRREWPRGIAP